MPSPSATEQADRRSGLRVINTNNDPDLDAFVFSTALEIGASGYKPKGKLRASDLDPNAPRVALPDPDRDGPLQIIADRSDRSSVISALVGANFEVMAPRFVDSPWFPRPFIDLSVNSVLTAEVALVRDGRPEPGQYAVDLESRLNPIGENLVLGTGSQLTAQEQGPAIFLGFGYAFTVDLESGSRLRIKPSFVYSRTRLELSGVAARAVREQRSTIGLGLDAYRFITLREDFSEVYHGIGPAIEFEIDTNNRLGPFELSLFLKAHANHVLGDRDTRLQQNNPDFPNEFVRFRYRHEPWTYRASTGIRFRLVGEK
ncbi:MAG: hypothetical protein AB8G23_18415 [Myxococcota bacterium]